MLPVTFCYLISYVYLEVLFKLIIGSPWEAGFLIGLCAVVFMAFLFSFINGLFKMKVHRILYFVNIGLVTLLFMVQNCLFAQYGFYFNFGLVNAMGQVAQFGKDIIKLIIREFIHLVLYALPFVLSLVFANRISFSRKSYPNFVRTLIACGVSLALLVVLGIWQREDFRENNNELYVDKMGVVSSFFMDGWRTVTHYEPGIYNDPETMDIHVSDLVYKDYDANVLDIDFAALAAGEKNEDVKTIHEFLGSQSVTDKNEKTGLFEGKNLVLFLAESFNRLAVREDTTPTLYRLIHEGFYFENFYSPHIMSTIGGEFQLLTSSVVSNGCLTGFKSGTNVYPFGVGTMFKNAGYSVKAYHNNSFSFQSRDKYIPEMGFDYYLACKNGLGQPACKGWPESDYEMINITSEEWIHEDHFMTYYITVSGHGPYSFDRCDNAIARKYQDILEGLNLPYDEPTQAYLAANIELDRALELLIQRLEEAGKLEDTVIALVGDHFPYYLTDEEISSLNGETIDMIIDVNHSNFILYNAATPSETVTKVGSQIDVLPTLYNLFNLPYDSRAIIGKDIFSTEPGLAIFDNNSWISDYGKYYTNRSQRWFPNEGVEVTDKYYKRLYRQVLNKISISRLMSQTNYYKYMKINN